MKMICELSDQGLIKIEGNDAKKFLQGQITCHVDNISMGAHCNPQGRIISLFYYFPAENACYLLMHRKMIPVTLSALKKYAVFFKASMEDASDALKIIGVNESGFESGKEMISIPVKNKFHILVGKFENLNATHAQDEWKKLMIEENIPAIYPETSGKFLPHDLGLHQLNALDFNKGCFIGQEIIARMHYRGKLKTHLYQASVSRRFQPAPGADIYLNQGDAWKQAGTVVDVSPQVYNNLYKLLIIANEVDSLFLMQNMESQLTIQDHMHV